MTSWPQSETDLLSPPTNPLENLRWRAQLTERWMTTPDVRKSLLSLSAKNILWTFNALFWTKDPRKSPSERPFCLYPYEVDLVHSLDQHLQAGKDVLIEKTRDMGVTWTMLGWLLWHWRFDPSFNAIVGSRLEDLIDEKGNLDTHFERLRWLCRSLPSWWMPHKFDEARHLAMAFSESKHIPYMRLMRPESDNTVVGESVTEDFSRQGRYNVAFLDEFAVCEHAEGAWTATADSTPMRVVVSTPNGIGVNRACVVAACQPNQCAIGDPGGNISSTACGFTIGSQYALNRTTGTLSRCTRWTRHGCRHCPPYRAPTAQPPSAWLIVV